MTPEPWVPKVGERAAVIVTILGQGAQVVAAVAEAGRAKFSVSAPEGAVRPDPVPLLREAVGLLEDDNFHTRHLPGEPCLFLCPGHHRVVLIEKVRAAYPEAFQEVPKP